VLIGDGELAEVALPACPYCLGTEASLMQPILSVPLEGQPGGVRVFPHPHPLYRIEGAADRRADGIYDRMRSLGAHEVIVESPDHDSMLSTAPEAHVTALLRCWALRIADLKNDLRFRYVTVFRNRGELAGQQIRHPHSELTATTFIPRRIVYELRAAQEYYKMKERCVFCDIEQQEEQQGLRVVDLTPRFLAVCPFSSRVPYEVWILPRYHHSSFETDLLRHPDRPSWPASCSELWRVWISSRRIITWSCTPRPTPTPGRSWAPTGPRLMMITTGTSKFSRSQRSRASPTASRRCTTAP
jgi:galactose-1-phosphate uridylyltransferase